MRFDPVKTRVNGFSEAMLKWQLATQYDPARPMGNVGCSDLSDVICAWLVGLHGEIAPVIARSLGWIDKAIAEDEQLGPDPSTHKRRLHWAKALGEWMDRGVNLDAEWGAARVHEEARWGYKNRPWPINEIIKSGLDDYMAFACQSGEDAQGFEAGIDRFERYTGRTQVSLSKAIKPRDFGYAVCLQRAGRQSFDENDLLKAGRKMLSANLQDTWLGGGQFVRAATWLKIVYSHSDNALTPLQVVLSAYDNMPKVPRPAFV